MQKIFQIIALVFLTAISLFGQLKPADPRFILPKNMKLPTYKGWTELGYDIYKDQIVQRNYANKSIYYRHRNAYDAAILPNVDMVPSRLERFLSKKLPASWQPVTPPWQLPSGNYINPFTVRL